MNEEIKRTAVEGEGAVVSEHEVEVVAAPRGGPVVGEGAAVVVEGVSGDGVLLG